MSEAKLKNTRISGLLSAINKAKSDNYVKAKILSEILFLGQFWFMSGENKTQIVKFEQMQTQSKSILYAVSLVLHP